MNKMKKLLSVVLAVVLAFSGLSILGSAAVTQYKTVANLANDGDGAGLDAYSPYGQVTRLSTEERASMVQDFLDTLLGKANLDMGTLIDAAGITVTVNLTSVDNLCGTVDSVKDALSNGLVGLVSGFIDLGLLEQINLDSWQSGMTRANNSQLDVFRELFELLNANKGVIGDILETGTLNLGIINLGDMSAVTDVIGNLPGLIKGLVYPLIERWDDTVALVKDYDNSIAGTGKNVEEIANMRVKKLFTDNMSITTLKYDVNGNMTSEHDVWEEKATGSAAPTASDSSLRTYYQFSSTTPGSVMTVYHIINAKEAKALADDANPDNDQAAYTYFKEEQQFIMAQEVPGSDTYVWKAKDAEKNEPMENTWSLKWYNDESTLIPGLTADVVNSKIDLSNTNISAGDLLYTFIPYLFEDLAVVVLNGSVKKILAEFFGATFNYVGDVGSDAVEALPDADADPIFELDHVDYAFEWSDYAVIGDNHYYRFEDQIYTADLSHTNNYFDIINWNYEITGEFMDDFVPANDSSASDRLLLNLNDFLVKVATTVTLPSANTEDTYVDPETNEAFTATWTRPAFQTGSNAYIVNNIKAAAQAVISLAPQHIFGSDYATNPRCYYDMFMYENADETTENAVILTGIAAQLVDIIMPSMTLPTSEDLIEDETRVGAILAGVIREFAAYLVPEYNFDALIYEDFGTTEADKVKTFLKGQSSEYWFDVCLTMGINVGYEYLRAFADLGEDTTEWAAMVADTGYGVDGKTYEAGTTQAALNAEWEGMLDYIIDWALTTDKEWAWKMANLVEVDGLTINLATAEDPWAKLDKILFGLIPFDEILSIETNEQYPTRVEKFLRYDLILGIVDLRWDALINTVTFNGEGNYFRTGNVLDQLAALIKRIVNGIFDKVGGGSYALIPTAIQDFDTLANQQNLATMIEGLLGALITAYNNGLLDTVFPILNMFLGWITDAQKIADPEIWETFPNGKDFAQGSGSSIGATTINFLNNSAGMLETHRNSDVVDHEYAIQIRSVTSDATVNTLSFNYGDGYVSPYETLGIAISGSYNGEEAATITITYEYLGKDGQAIGGLQTTSRTIFFSNQAEDADYIVAEGDMKSGLTWQTKRAAYNKYIFAEDIYDAITNATLSVRYKNSVSGSTPFAQYEAPDLSIEGGTSDNGTPDNSCDDYTIWLPEDYPEYDQYAEQYFTYNPDKASAGWPDSISSNLITGWGQGGGKFYAGKAEYGKDYNYPIGIYAFQPVSVTYDGEAVYQQVFIHYDDYGVYEIYTDNLNNGYNANQGVDAATYNAYNTAWKNIVRLATYPLMTELNNHGSVDYIKVIMPQIEPAIAAFEEAKEAYEEALAEAQSAGSAAAALPAYVEALREEIDDDFIVVDEDTKKEINFQDVEFYEYFNYNDVKVEAENLYRSYLAPEVMDKYYILGSGISQAELDDVIDAEANPFIAAGITASRLENDQAAIDASIAAKDEWKMPVNTKLKVEDMKSRLVYYKQFVVDEDNREDADHMYFLEQEIAHVEAQGFVEADYEAVSWARYADALEVAKAVAAGEDDYSAFNSRIYDVKYNLMTARKQLLKKADSLIEAGGTADLLANIEDANEIFTSLNAGDGLWTLKEGVDANAAYAQLISALGYYYVGEDGNTWNLYADSALEYADNDRPNKQANQAKVDAANANLVAAIENFEYEEPVVMYTVTYTDGANGTVFANKEYTVEEGSATPAFDGSLEREGFEFTGWSPAVAATVTGDVTYVAQWEEIPAEPNTLVLNENAPFEAIIDTMNGGDFTGAVYGFDTLGWNDDFNVDGAIADFVTTAYGDDYLEVIIPDTADGETTGTIINVLDEDGNVVESYVYIYFGDVDMDGLVGSSDAGMAEYYEMMYEGFDTLYQFMAGDLDGDSMPGAADAGVMEFWEMNYFGMVYQPDVGAVAQTIPYEIY